MLSQATQTVRVANVSLNTEMEVVRRLSAAAQKEKCFHGVLLMVELGDLREGIMPDLIESAVREVLHLPNITFIGIGTNLACRSGVVPEAKNMAALSALADTIDSIFGPIVNTVSGGNSANLEWILSATDTGRINNLRLGEAMLLGCEPLCRKPLKGLHTNAITLVAEVIELNNKPSQPWGKIAQSAFGTSIPYNHSGNITQAILAIGRQDIDPDGLLPPLGLKILAASSDHLVVDASNYPEVIKVGTEISFQLGYSALLRAMTSPFISKVMSTPLVKLKTETI